MLILNALSRAYVKNSKPEFDVISCIRPVHFEILNLPVSSKYLWKLEVKIKKDKNSQIFL